MNRSFLRIAHYLLGLTALSFSLLTFTGCDAINDAVNDAIPPVEVDLGSAGENLPVAPGATSQTSTVDGTDTDLPNRFDVKSLELEGVSFQPMTAGKVAASGNVAVFLIIDQVPVVGAVVAVENDEVTGINPNPIELGRHEGLMDCYEKLDENGRPTLNASGDAEATVKNALEAESFTLTVMACVSGDLVGTLNIETAVIDVEV